MGAKLDRYMRLSVEEGLNLITDVKSVYSTQTRPEVHGVPCRLHGLRLMTFKHKGTSCVSCKIAGSFFAIERNLDRTVVNRDAFSSEPYHMNLYAFNSNGEEVLMTHDHILARALGGKDALENAQPMCEWCNSRKGNVEQQLLLLIQRYGKKVDKLTDKVEVYKHTYGLLEFA